METPVTDGDPVSIQADETEVTVSDLHLSEGPTIRVREKQSAWRRAWRWLKGRFTAVEPPPFAEIPNPLEDFRHDRQFAKFLEHVVADHGDARVLRLRLMGDTFDPLVMRWRGRIADPPYESVGVFKMRKIIRGHPAFFDALAAFIRRPNCRLDVFVGNHDLFLVWPRVQRAIIKRLAGADSALAEKIRFIDHRQDFEDEYRGVLYYHGMNAEPHNTVDGGTTIITERFGKKLRRPVLNMPLGSYLTVYVANTLKLWNALVGRVPMERDVWKHAAKFLWGWALYAAYVFFRFIVWSRLFAFWDLRRKTGLVIIIRAMLATATDNPTDRYAEKLLKERKNIRLLVMGHTHIWRRISTPLGTYINTGSWALMYRLVEPSFTYSWRRFRRFERPWRAFLHFLKTRELRYTRRRTTAFVFMAAVAALVTFLFISFPKEGWDFLSYNPSDLKLPIAVLLAFLTAFGLARLFTVRPDEVPAVRFTFGLVRHSADGNLSAELMEYLPDEDAIRECV